MSTVSSHFGVEKIEGPCYGVEVESEWLSNTERSNAFRAVSAAPWDGTIDDDDSLRCGIEFVSSPLNLEDSLTNLRVLFDLLETTNVRASERTSIHVHINCSDLSFQQVGILLLCWGILEEGIVATFCPERWYSHFCFPMAKSYGSLAACKRFLEGQSGANDRGNKYCSLNFSRLSDIGTAEVRVFPFTTDFQRVSEFITICHSLRMYAATAGLEDVRDIVDRIADTPEVQRELVDNIFPPAIQGKMAGYRWNSSIFAQAFSI